MKKRVFSVLLVCCLAAGILPMTAQAAASIQVGQYVQMGTYYGAPILWRCVDIDENGPLMLSDRVLCLKAYDAGGEDTSGSHSEGLYRRSRGSSYWADSNLRSWLNSSASAGNVEWLCGNPPDNDHVYDGYNDYADEAGFLTSFSQSELDAILEVTQKSPLSYYDGSKDTTGAKSFFNGACSTTKPGNFDECRGEYVTDKMFLLDSKQIVAICDNASVLGEYYLRAKPTAECVANSTYGGSLPFNTEETWDYWTRLPVSDPTSDDQVMYVAYAHPYIHNTSAASSDIGVRPAFYLNLSSASFASGSGTASDPYTVAGGGSASAPASTPAAPTAYQSTQSVLVDGTAVEFQCYALKDANGNLTNYIKLRDLASILSDTEAQFQVGWDGDVTITTKVAYTPNGSEGSTPFSGDRTYQENTATTKVNGQAAELDAFVLNDDTGGGYTYYQLRDLGQAIGFNVGWSADKGIFVETDKPYDPAD